MKLFHKNVAAVSSITFLSRIFGYLRDMTIAFFLGAGLIADSFFVAFRIPNLLRRLLAEGTFSAAFIPVYSSETTKSEDDANRLATSVLINLFLLLVLICFAGIIFMPYIVALITLDFSFKSVNFQETVVLAKIMFPFILFASLSSVFYGILQTKNNFYIPALSSVVLNIFIILSAFVYYFFYGKNEGVVLYLAYGVLTGGAAQLILQIIPSFKKGFKLKRIFYHPALLRILFLMGPGVIGLAVAEINIIVDTMLAWQISEGAVSYLYYSNRIMQLPLGIFAISIATVSLPALSKLFAAGKKEIFFSALNKSMNLMYLIIIPAMLGIIALKDEIINVLFQRGNFVFEDTKATAAALMYYSLGLIAYSGVRIVGQAFYAMKDTKTPVYIGAFCMILNIGLNLIFMTFLSFYGLALASAVSSAFNLLLLMHFLKKKTAVKFETENFIKTVFASIIMAVFIFILKYFFGSGFFNMTFFLKAALLSFYIFSAAAVYFLCAGKFKLFNLKEIWKK